jgi:hypothetical protein
VKKTRNFLRNSLDKPLFSLTPVKLHLELLNVIGKKRHAPEKVSPAGKNFGFFRPNDIESPH